MHLQVASPDAWQAALDELRLKEKAATRARDALAAERRRLPVVRIEKDYVFEGPDGSVSLVDLFNGRRQLIVYHFMFASGVEGWPAVGRGERGTRQPPNGALGKRLVQRCAEHARAPVASSHQPGQLFAVGGAMFVEGVLDGMDLVVESWFGSQ
jgi:Bacterial protein of unknown function (DUF899)